MVSVGRYLSLHVVRVQHGIERLLPADVCIQTPFVDTRASDVLSAAVLDMALDDIECKDSICRYDTAGRTFYKDMLTNETWAPMMVPGSSSGMTVDQAKEALKRSRGVSGRVWKPSLFS